MMTTGAARAGQRAIWPWLFGAISGALLTAWAGGWRANILWLGALAGAWWAAHVVPDTSRSEQRTGAGPLATWGGFAVILGAACAILFARKPDAWLNPQLWAEDGAIFVRDAWLRGLAAIVEPYAGYLHLLPRFVAAVARNLPVALVPRVFLAGSLLPVIALAALLSSPRLPLHSRDRLILMAVAVLPPMPGEVLLNTTNAQWILGFVFVTLLFVEDDARRHRAWGDAALLSLAGLTGPFSLVLAPLHIARAFLQPRRANVIRAVAVALAASVQGLLLARSGRMAIGQPAPPDLFLAALGARMARYLHPGSVSEEQAFLIAVVIMCAVVLFVGVLVASSQWMSAVCGVAAILLFASYLLALRQETDRIAFGDDRYFSLPLALLLWSCVLARDSLRLTSGTLAAGLICVSAPAFHVMPSPDRQWRERAACLEQPVECHVPINPEGWSIDLPAR
ncbi:MAG: hypothetical protein AB7I50_09730 [Vicinamibacterales bacterium]